MLKDELHPWAMRNLTKIVNTALEYGIEDREFWYGRDSKGKDRVVFWMETASLPSSFPEIVLERNGPLESLEEEGLLSVRYGSTTGNKFYRIKRRGIRAVKANFEFPTLSEELASSIHSVSQPKMSTLPLIDRQKKLIRSLGPGLKSGDIGATWTLHYGDDKILGIDVNGLGFSSDLWDKHWRQATEADFAAFVSCGLFLVDGRDSMGKAFRYHLNQARIEQAIEQDFRIESSTGITNINMRVGGDISGQVNIAGHDINQGLSAPEQSMPNPEDQED